MVAQRARETGAAFALCNAVGGQDELVFDGHSVVVDEAGETVARAAQFAEELLVCDLDLQGPARRAAKGPGAGPGRRSRRRCSRASTPSRAPSAASARSPSRSSPDAEVYAALVLGLRDYVDKNGFERVRARALGRHRLGARRRWSPSTRSGPSACRASHALPPLQRRRRRPTRAAIAENLGAELIELPIEAAMGAYDELPRTAPSPGRAGHRPSREHPGADPRQPRDGAVEPRSAGCVLTTRQQERDVGRLRDALRRHGGRLRRDQGRAEDARLRAGRATATSARDAS